ncbi:MAG TPA: hypothetical protein VFE47_01785 [Tepidisphaeraceae bacterium]|jgi:hypothetical protein|nr:hypothetical protein [Tepidisphaeraceae bacterium]
MRDVMPDEDIWKAFVTMVQDPTREHYVEALALVSAHSNYSRIAL